MAGRTAGVLVLVVGALAVARARAEGRAEDPGDPSQAGTLARGTADGADTPTPEELDRLHDEEVARLLEGLAGYADWCANRKLFARRAEACELVLAFDPANEAAHRALGHQKKGDGTWEEVPPRRPPRDYDAAALKQAPAELAKVITPLVAHLVDAVASAGLPPEEARARLADVFRVAPDDERAHALVGDVRAPEGGWVLSETLAAKAGRTRIRDLVRKAYQEVPPIAAAPLLPREEAFGLPFTGAVAGPLARVVGTVPVEELTKTCRALHIAQRVFRDVLGVDTSYDPHLTVFLLEPAQKSAFLEHHPALSPKERERLASFDGTGVQGTGDFASWAPDEARRRDATVRFAVGWMSAISFGASTTQGWIYEGCGLYLTRETIGTRLSWFAHPSGKLSATDEAALRARLLDDATNWMNEALSVLQSDRRPALESVMRKSANELTTEDLLFTYVTAAYLFEARTPAETADLLRRAGHGLPPAQAVQAALGTSVPELDARIGRWLTERH